jgi:hypothetical protein
MLLIVLFAALLIISGALAFVAKAADGGWNAVATILASVVGGLIAVIGQELCRRLEGNAREKDLLEALRIEVIQNVQISNSGKDEKRRAYSTTAWEAFRPHLLSLNSEIMKLLTEGYSNAYMHRQTLQVELLHTGHGQSLVDFSNNLNIVFTMAINTANWKMK